MNVLLTGGYGCIGSWIAKNLLQRDDRVSIYDLKESPSILSMTNPTSGGRPGRNRHVVHADETLMSIAMQAFGTPSAWRAIAEVNRIDDPNSLQPGDVIYLPARDELRDLAEEAR